MHINRKSNTYSTDLKEYEERKIERPVSMTEYSGKVKDLPIFERVMIMKNWKDFRGNISWIPEMD